MTTIKRKLTQNTKGEKATNLMQLLGNLRLNASITPAQPTTLISTQISLPNIPMTSNVV